MAAVEVEKGCENFMLLSPRSYLSKRLGFRRVAREPVRVLQVLHRITSILATKGATTDITTARCCSGLWWPWMQLVWCFCSSSHTQAINWNFEGAHLYSRVRTVERLRLVMPMYLTVLGVGGATIALGGDGRRRNMKLLLLLL